MAWFPCSGLESAEEVVWLPRLLDKARRVNATGGSNAVDGYLYGDNDFIDKRVLRFLGMNGDDVRQVVRDDPDNAARIIVERSGRSVEERRAFSRQMRRTFFDFALLEADEGRMPGGLKRSTIRFLYNRVMMPLVYLDFRRSENKRAG